MRTIAAILVTPLAALLACACVAAALGVTFDTVAVGFVSAVAGVLSVLAARAVANRTKPRHQLYEPSKSGAVIGTDYRPADGRVIETTAREDRPALPAPGREVVKR